MKVSHQRPPFLQYLCFPFYYAKHPAPFAQGAFPLKPLLSAVFSGRKYFISLQCLPVFPVHKSL